MHLLPMLATLLLWFASTALIVWLDSRSPRTFRFSLALGALIALGGIAAVATTAADDGIAAAYISFAGALAVWGWHEMSFLMGAVAGPRRLPCPPTARGWTRFRLATATVIHHELALAGTAILLLAVSWGAPNQTGAAAFALLFALRLSAKLNIFIGVPSFGDELLPAHLAYLKSYFGRRPSNPLMALSLAASVGLTGWLAAVALAADGGAAVSASLLFALAALGVLEHLFLLMPLRDAALWRWALPAGAGGRE